MLEKLRRSSRFVNGFDKADRTLRELIGEPSSPVPPCRDLSFVWIVAIALEGGSLATPIVSAEPMPLGW